MVAEILLIRPRLKSSTAPRHACSNPGLGCSPLSSVFSAMDSEQSVPEEEPMTLGPASRYNVLDPSAV